jgi:hypothetical protein
MTPVQVLKNLGALFQTETYMTPSAQLVQLVRVNIAAQALETNELALGGHEGPDF